MSKEYFEYKVGPKSSVKEIVETLELAILECDEHSASPAIAAINFGGYTSYGASGGQEYREEVIKLQAIKAVLKDIKWALSGEAIENGMESSWRIRS